MIDPLTNLTELLVYENERMIHTQPVWMIDRTGLNDSFTKLNDKFTHKMTCLRKLICLWNGLTDTFTNRIEQFIYEFDWFSPICSWVIETLEPLNRWVVLQILFKTIKIPHSHCINDFNNFIESTSTHMSFEPITARMLLSSPVSLETATMETMTGPIDYNPTIPCPLGMYSKSFRLEGVFIQVTSKVD